MFPIDVPMLSNICKFGKLEKHDLVKCTKIPGFIQHYPNLSNMHPRYFKSISDLLGFTKMSRSTNFLRSERFYGDFSMSVFLFLRPLKPIVLDITKIMFNLLTPTISKTSNISRQDFDTHPFLNL